MKISFFEEFPEKGNLDKLKLITWPSNLFLAAHSVKIFKILEKQVKSINKKITCIYWPVLTQEEGYWISPLSSPKALKRVFEEILHIPVPVMLD
ncbi:MAG: hypothetical protein QF632_02170, partial [Candidatus Woesearchaeota archaeon]|nr:hypothetical protein [Candidatus Woesearchaeota archaeon]